MNDAEITPIDPGTPADRHAVTMLVGSLERIARDVRALSRDLSPASTPEHRAEIVAGTSAAIPDLIAALRGHKATLDRLIEQHTDTQRELVAVRDIHQRRWGLYGGVSVLSLVGTAVVAVLRDHPFQPIDLLMIGFSALSTAAAWLERSPRKRL